MKKNSNYENCLTLLGMTHFLNGYGSPFEKNLKLLEKYMDISEKESDQVQYWRDMAQQASEEAES